MKHADFLFNTARKLRRPFLTWKFGQHEEKEFWENYMRTKGLEWPHEYAERTSPDFQLQDNLRELLNGADFQVQILDVGSGPLTAVGSKWSGHFVNVVALDPLADWYEGILKDYGLHPRATLVRGKGEQIAKLFSPDTFDLVHARNSVDHSIDPVKVLRGMVRVVKPGRYLFLNHNVNEGVAEEYRGPHQWNICIENGALTLWSRAVRYNLSELLNQSCSEIRWETDCHGWLLVRIKKRS